VKCKRIPTKGAELLLHSFCAKCSRSRGRKVECVTVQWHGPYRLDRLGAYDVSYMNGVYAISSTRAGKEKLHYIGRTMREFATRINEHLPWIGQLTGEVKVRFGTLQFEPGRRFSEDKLSDVEALLITHHVPPWNKSNSRFYRGRRELTVQNVGRKGNNLTPSVSSEELDWT